MGNQTRISINAFNMLRMQVLCSSQRFQPITDYARKLCAMSNKGKIDDTHSNPE